MDIKTLALCFQKQGMDISKGSFADIDFDLIVKKKILGGYILVLVKQVPKIDDVAASEWETKFDTIVGKCKGLLISQPFYVCLVSGKVAPSGVEKLTRLGKMLGTIHCTVFVADEKKCTVHGNVPLLPAVNKSWIELIRKIFGEASLLS